MDTPPSVHIFQYSRIQRPTKVCVGRIFYPRLTVTLDMASYVTIAIILAVLAVVASTLYNINKSKNTFQRPDGPAKDYYQNSMQSLASMLWTTSSGRTGIT